MSNTIFDKYNWNCERCGSDFIIPPNALNSLMTAATHCAKCVSDLSAKFSARFPKVGA